MKTLIIIIIMLVCIIAFQLYVYFKLKAELKDSEYRNESLLGEINSVEYVQKRKDREQMDAYFEYITQMENEKFRKEVESHDDLPY